MISIICVAIGMIGLIIAIKINKTCRHNWQEINREDVDMYFSTEDRQKGAAPMYFLRTYFYRCSECGITKMQRFKY